MTPKKYQYILDGAVDIDKRGEILFGFRIREGIGFGDEKIQEVLNHCLDRGINKVIIETTPEWEKGRRRVLVTGKK